MHKSIIHWLRSLALLCALGLSQLHAYTHPCVPTTREELDTIKANLAKEPWKTGYEGLAAASTSQLTYAPNGPHAEVGRTPDVNLTYWKNDMVAVYNLSLMWYFTGNNAYAQKPATCSSHGPPRIRHSPVRKSRFRSATSPSLMPAAPASCAAPGPDGRRPTPPRSKNYFLNVYWPASIAGFNTTGPANKGMIYLQAGMAIAAFLDDTEKFNHCINVYRTNPASGLRNTLAIGEMGETGRDQGHAYGTLLGMTLISEIAWKQGIDLYSEMDNRLLAVGEYYARNSLGLNNPFVNFGTIDSLYWANNSYYFIPDNAALLIIRNAYKNRKNLPTPWIDRKLESLGGGGNLMYSKAADFTTASPAAAISFPEVSPASSGLTLTTLGTQTAGRSSSYSNGVWTVTGLGGGAWSDGADDGQFAYKAMTGDCALVARMTSATYSGSQNGKHALMIRDNLVGAISQRAWIGLVPTQAGGFLLESHFRGWTEVWGGPNRDDISHGFPPGVPYWLKIERRGGMINAYTSLDGTSWSVRLNGYFANLPSTVYIGLFVCSGNATSNTTTWSNVAFTGGTGGLVTTPAAPAAMLASGSNKAITARWLASFGATGYDLLRSTTSGSGYSVIASNLPADKTSYADTTASPGTTYYYVARAKNSAGTSGNSPEFSAALLPVGMVNLATTGTTTDDQNNPANAYNAFDQDNGSLWFHGGGTTGWLQYDFGAGNAQVIKRYTVNSAPLIPERDPKNWQFQGSQDGSTWTTLDTQSNQTFTYRMQRNTYDIGNTTAYRFYRFNVTANNGHVDILHIGDIGLWSDAGRTIPDGTYAIVSRNSNKVIDLVSGGTADGTDAVQWAWNAGGSQKWNLTHLGNGQETRRGPLLRPRGGVVVVSGGLPACAPTAEVRASDKHVGIQSGRAAEHRHHLDGIVVARVGVVVFAEFFARQGKPAALKFGDETRGVLLQGTQRHHALGAARAGVDGDIKVVAVEHLRKRGLLAQADFLGPAGEHGNLHAGLLHGTVERLQHLGFLGPFVVIVFVLDLDENDALGPLGLAGDLLAGDQRANGLVPMHAPRDVIVMRSPQPELLAEIGAELRQPARITASGPLGADERSGSHDGVEAEFLVRHLEPCFQFAQIHF